MVELTAPEVLNYTYAFMVENMEPDQRKELDEMLRPEKFDATQMLPERLRGMTPPPGWKAVSDPWGR